MRFGMIRTSRNSSLRPRRSKLLRCVAHQRETGRDFGLKPVTTGSTRQCVQSQRDLMANASHICGGGVGGGPGGGGGGGGGCCVSGLGSEFCLIHEI
jgi:hypothetical protein